MTEDMIIRSMAKAGYGPDAIADEVGIPVEDVLMVLDKQDL